MEKLTTKQKIFCEEYILDWNATRAAKVAGYSEKTANVIGSENLTKPYIKAYIGDIQRDIEKQAGISRLMVINEFKKIAFSSIANLHNSWIERADFDLLTDDQKACIEIIDTKIKKIEPDDGSNDVTEVEQIRVKLYDKQKALENISKMLGYYEPDKLDHTSGGKTINPLRVVIENE